MDATSKEEARARAHEARKRGVDADRGEEIYQQEMSSRQVEFDFDAENDIDRHENERNEQSAAHGLGDVEVAERAEPPVQGLADEKHDDRRRERDEGLNANDVAVKFHVFAPRPASLTLPL